MSVERQAGALRSMLEGFDGADVLFADSDDETPRRSGGNGGNKGNNNGEPPTPPLSLPDSFDEGEYFPPPSKGRRGDNNTDSGKGNYKEVSRLQSLLTERNEKFRDLNISENLYNDLRLRPESDLSLFELAQLKSHEFTVTSRREVEKLRRNLQDTANELISQQARAEENESRLNRISKKAGLDADSAKMEVSALEERCARLSLRLKDETVLRQEGEDKAQQFDRQQKLLESTTKEFSALKKLYEQQSSTLATLTVSEGASRTAERDSDRAKELLALDKAHLSQELRAAESRADSASKTAESATAKVAALEMKNQQLADQLLSSQVTGSSGLEARLEKETQRIRDDCSAQIDSIKAATRDMMDRENAVLREAKAAAEATQENQKRTIEHLGNETQRLQTELTQQQARAMMDVNDVKSELKLKTFELASTGSMFDERMGMYRQALAELETCKAELHVHRQAFLRLESESEVSLVETRSQLVAAKARLAGYEALEEEIDGAVLRVAQAGQLTAAGQVANDNIDKENVENLTKDLATNSFFHSLKSMPSHPERRARQAVLLAQKVLETEAQRDEQTQLVVSLRSQLQEAKEAEAEAESALKRSNQPTVYLVTKLRDEEAALNATKKKLLVQEQVVAQVLEQKKSLVADNDAIRERMRLMLHQRGEIDQLRGLLETLQAPEAPVATHSLAPTATANVAVNAPAAYADTHTLQSTAADAGDMLDEPSYDDGVNVSVSTDASKGPAPVRALARPAAIDTSVGASLSHQHSQSPTPTAAHSHSEHRHDRHGHKVQAPSPEQIDKMVTSPTAKSASPHSRSKWHTREEL